MLDEERIRLMTQMASYENGEGRRSIPIASYFRGDYISFNVVKTAIYITIAYVIIVMTYIYYNAENMIGDIYKFDLVSIARNVLIGYIVVVAAYSIVAYVIYSIRYNRARQSMHDYYAALKKLSAMYEEEQL